MVLTGGERSFGVSRRSVFHEERRESRKTRHHSGEGRKKGLQGNLQGRQKASETRRQRNLIIHSLIRDLLNRPNMNRRGRQTRQTAFEKHREIALLADIEQKNSKRQWKGDKNKQ
mmetsp:Transcript_11486/g.22132  ORF Transcript_11486/g.22132 Transcript_11486/m.22132 type:complete len:115 (+) Transcript_11486:1664-2008(+)